MSTVACGNPLAPPPTSFRPLGASACPTTPGPHWTHVTDLLNLLRPLHQFMPLGDCSPVATHRKPGVKVQSKPLQPQLPGCLATLAVTSGAPQWRKTPVATRRGGVGLLPSPGCHGEYRWALGVAPRRELLQSAEWASSAKQGAERSSTPSRQPVGPQPVWLWADIRRLGSSWREGLHFIRAISDEYGWNCYFS